jgi:ubiquinone/menaquinone biosynthesis C-methylase UbiE
VFGLSDMDDVYQEPMFVEAYDAFYPSSHPQVPIMVEFYDRLARTLGGPILAVACGTGRIALPLAEAGHEMVGADRSNAMLAVARRKLAALPAAVQERVTFINQDMSALNLDRRFGLVFVPARSFQHLLTVDLQRRALAAFRRHLELSGRLVLQLFDPRFDLLIDAPVKVPELTGTHPDTGRRYVGEVLRSELDQVHQVRRELWRYADLGPRGEVLAESTAELAIRWTYRWELHHLLELCGFAVEDVFSDYNRSAPTYGKELIVVARLS